LHYEKRFATESNKNDANNGVSSELFSHPLLMGNFSCRATSMKALCAQSKVRLCFVESFFQTIYLRMMETEGKNLCELFFSYLIEQQCSETYSLPS
jgi:hypothetical protein